MLRAGYRLEVGEEAVAVSVVTDSDGRFLVCGVPSEPEVTAAAAIGSRRSAAPVRRINRAIGLVRLVVP